MSQITQAVGAPLERHVRAQRWTGVVQAHCSGGFVAVGDYMLAMDEIERLRSLLAESASCISCYFNGVAMDDVIRPDAHELWRRCMVELGHDKGHIDGLSPNV